MDYLFVVNANSQTVKKKGSVLVKVTAGPEVHVEHLSDFSVLDALVENAIGAKTHWVFIEGGDGTAHGVITAFMRRRESFEAFPKFTILPGGMTNQIAKNIGVKRVGAADIEKMMRRNYDAGYDFPLLRLDIKGAPSEFGFVFSSGGIPSATEYCTSEVYDKGLGGSLAVAATIARGFAGSKRIRDEMMPATPVSLRVTGKKEEVHLKGLHLATLVTTLPGLILNIDPFWGEGEGPLRLTYAQADPRRMVRNLIGIWMGRKHKSRKADGFESFNAVALHYDYDGPVVLDGEKIALPHGELDIYASAPVTFVR